MAEFLFFVFTLFASANSFFRQSCQALLRARRHLFGSLHLSVSGIDIIYVTVAFVDGTFRRFRKIRTSLIVVDTKMGPSRCTAADLFIVYCTYVYFTRKLSESLTIVNPSAFSMAFLKSTQCFLIIGRIPAKLCCLIFQK